MEFVIVTFPTLRRVRVDGAQQGNTGQILGVQQGVHVLDLAGRKDFTPPFVQTTVSNTSAQKPLVIAFTPAPVGIEAVTAAPGMESAPRMKAKKATAKKPKKAKKASPQKKAGTKKGTKGRKPR